MFIGLRLLQIQLAFSRGRLRRAESQALTVLALGQRNFLVLGVDNLEAFGQKATGERGTLGPSRPNRRLR